MADSSPNELNQAKQRIARLEREITEYIRAEEVLIAAGLVSKDKVEKAHEIVRGFTHDA